MVLCDFVFAVSVVCVCGCDNLLLSHFLLVPFACWQGRNPILSYM